MHGAGGGMNCAKLHENTNKKIRRKKYEKCLEICEKCNIIDIEHMFACVEEMYGTA